MVAFGGWEMPLRFATGTIAEHLACRRGAAVFDVSHLGTVRLQGPDAWEKLQSTLTNDLSKIAPGRAQYTHLLDEDGSVLDDMIIWWVAEERFDVMPNASNTSRVRDALGGEDATAERAVIALQGPATGEVLAEAFPEAVEVGRSQVRQLSWSGQRQHWRAEERSRHEARREPGQTAARCPSVPTVVAGTGYTGEDGVEVAVPAEAATALWEAFISAGAVPAGLGARDTLRLEAGLPLHGHELGPGITPLEAGLSWAVAWEKPGGFRGLPALLERRRAGTGRRLMGLVGDGRQPFREGYSVELEGPVGPEGEGPQWAYRPGPAGGGLPGAPERPLALLTSGNFSPLLERGIGMCFLPAGTPPGSRAKVRGDLPATVVKLPFVRRVTDAQLRRPEGRAAATAAAQKTVGPGE